MKEHIKNYLGLSGTAALAAIAIAALVFAYTYANSFNPSEYRTFSVSGTGEAVVIPDVAQIRIGLVTQGSTDLAPIQQENSEKMNAVIAFLKEQGVEEKDIKTTSYSVDPRYQYSNCGFRSAGETCPPPEIVGYEINQSVNVKIRDFDTIGDIMSGVVNKGANTVGGLTFTTNDPDAAKKEAREAAIIEAREKAEAIAEAGGFRVGRLVNIHETPVYPGPYYYEDAALGRGGSEGALAPTIEPGSQDVDVTINMTFEIK